MRLVACDDITDDMILAKTVYKNEQVYLTAGQSILTRFLNSLKSLGVAYLYVEDEASEGIEIPDVVTEETRTKCKEALQSTFTKFKKASVLDISEISCNIDRLMDEILENPDVQLSLMDISASDDYTFSHSVSATVYALMLGQQLNYKKSMLKKLAIGTVLHDLGKTILDRNILYKPGRLTPEEMEYVKQHTTYGYEALQQCRSITELSRMIALTHHERMDGTGYPQHLKGGELHEFSRIAAIADVFDALTSDRCYRSKWSANKAVEFMVQNSGTQFDSDLLGLFIRQIAIYPNGTLVTLSNGCKALVKEQNRSAPQRPVVRVVRGADNRTVAPYEIDLMEELSIVIVSSQVEEHR